MRKSTKRKLKNSLREIGLVIDSGDTNGDSRKPREAIVNNSDSRYFVKSIQGETIDDATVEKLEKQFQKTLSWIGPVYKIPTVQATYDAVVPTPNVLLLKISPFARSVENVIKKIKSSFSLSEVEGKSKHLNNIRYFEMKDSSKQNAYGLKDQIMKMSEGAVQNVSYENIPYYVPLCVTPNDTLFASQWDMTQIQAPAKDYQYTRWAPWWSQYWVTEPRDCASRACSFASTGVGWEYGERWKIPIALEPSESWHLLRWNRCRSIQQHGRDLQRRRKLPIRRLWHLATWSCRWN
jgi:hypothetical protein